MARAVRRWMGGASTGADDPSGIPVSGGSRDRLAVPSRVFYRVVISSGPPDPVNNSRCPAPRRILPALQCGRSLWPPGVGIVLREDRMWDPAHVRPGDGGPVAAGLRRLGNTGPAGRRQRRGCSTARARRRRGADRRRGGGLHADPPWPPDRLARPCHRLPRRAGLVLQPDRLRQPRLDRRRRRGAMGRDRRRQRHHPQGAELRLADRGRLHPALGDAHRRPEPAGRRRPRRLLLDGRRHRPRPGELHVQGRPAAGGLDRDPQGGGRALFDRARLFPPLRAGLRRRRTSAT